MRTAQAQRYIRLFKSKQALNAKIKKINEQLSSLEETLGEQFINDGAQSVSMHGFTIYLKADLRVSSNGDADALREALGEHGYHWLMMASTQKLAGWVRELRQNDKEIPPELAPYIKVREVIKVACRKA